MTEYKINRYEYALIIILSLTGCVFFVGLPEKVIGKDTYIALLAGLGIGVFIAAVFATIIKNCGGRRLADINKMLFKKAGHVITFFYSIYFLLVNALLLDYYGVFTVDTILGGIPEAVLFASIMAVVAFASLKGAFVMGRMGVIFSYVILACVAASFLLELPQADIQNLLPVLSSDKNDILQMCILFGFLQFGDIICVLCLSAYTDKQTKILKISVISTVIGGGIVFAFCLLNALCLGDSLLYQYSGFLRIMKLVDFGSILNRLEVVVVAGYFFATVFRLMTGYFVAADSLDCIFNKNKDPRIKWGILIASSAFIVVFAVSICAEQFIKSGYLFLAPVFQLVLPLVMLFLSLKIKQRC